MIYDIIYYWKTFGFIALLRKVKEKIVKLIWYKEERARLMEEARIQTRKQYLKPVQVYSFPGQKRRVTLVSLTGEQDPDKLNAAILLSLELAVARKYDLRILSKHGVNKNDFYDLLKVSGIPYIKNVDFLTLERIESGGGIEIGSADIYICTSWLSVYKLTEGVNPQRIIYLVSDDERQRLQAEDRDLCLGVMNNRHINFVVTSRTLYDFLVSEGFSHICDRGVWLDSEDSYRVERWEQLLSQHSGYFDRISPCVPV